MNLQSYPSLDLVEEVGSDERNSSSLLLFPHPPSSVPVLSFDSGRRHGP